MAIAEDCSADSLLCRTLRRLAFRFKARQRQVGLMRQSG
jgi:hypothetical protein